MHSHSWSDNPGSGGRMNGCMKTAANSEPYWVTGTIKGFDLADVVGWNGMSGEKYSRRET